MAFISKQVYLILVDFIELYILGIVITISIATESTIASVIVLNCITIYNFLISKFSSHLLDIFVLKTVKPFSLFTSKLILLEYFSNLSFYLIKVSLVSTQESFEE